MKRREFFKLVGGVATGWPLAALAQQQAGKLPKIGIITVEPSELTEALSQGLREDIILDMRYHHGSLERIDEFAREIVGLKCSIIVTGSPYAIRAVIIETDDVERVLTDIDADHGNCVVEVLAHGVLLVFGAPCQIRDWWGRSTAGPSH
jgi:hypothetical protein